MTNLIPTITRLRRVAAGESIYDVYYRPEDGGSGFTSQRQMDRHRDDRQTFADAMFDPEPIAGEWLESITDSCVFGIYCLYATDATLFIANEGEGWNVTINSVRGQYVTTRGQLLALLFGLGVLEK